ncbi:MAG: tRNA 2-thiouridine(34) synthase MnmA [Tissierellia bacterium]|nr:tRNA 2-thiouridine(34) synthase MnmA [Tissierellia bacterium]
MNKKRVAVALSGGVDSGAAAYVLKEKGYEVFGITMKLFNNFNEEDAKYVAQKLNIDHYIVDFRDIFKKTIIDYFINEYLIGRTPNPCIYCNMKIKYGLLLDEAERLGADFIATGHYANIIFNDVDSKYCLYKSKVKAKDQSYYLYHLNQNQLSKILFPLTEFENKDEVREIVKDIIPKTSVKKDSLNICFTNNMPHYLFIKKECGLINTKGNFVHKNGKVLGKHKGAFYYTIGQKIGEGINSDKPLYVVSINSFNNEIILGENKETFKKEIVIKDIKYIDENNKNVGELDCEVKLCQWGYFIKCKVINYNNNTALIRFYDYERAPAPGQAAVFYKGDEVLGGGIIN